jgi:hypothetical protein
MDCLKRAKRVPGCYKAAGQFLVNVYWSLMCGIDTVTVRWKTAFLLLGYKYSETISRGKLCLYSGFVWKTRESDENTFLIA